jgi:hypothetical protein
MYFGRLELPCKRPAFAMLNACRLECKIRARENSVSEPRTSSYSQLITLKWDSTVGVPRMTVAMPPQNCLNFEKRIPTTICEVHHAGLKFKPFTQAISLWMAHLNSFNSLARAVQSY